MTFRGENVSKSQENYVEIFEDQSQNKKNKNRLEIQDKNKTKMWVPILEK